MPPAAGAAGWRAAGGLGQARAEHAAVLLAGRRCQAPEPPAWCGSVLVAGGTSAEGPSAAAELFTLGRGWRSAPALPVAVARPAAVQVDGPGCSATAAPEPCGDVVLAGDGVALSYDPDDGAWSELPAPAGAPGAPALVALPDGRVLLAGGSAEAGVQIFDPLANAWSQIAAGAVARSEGHSATLLGDGRVLVAGGLTPAGSATAATEIVDPAGGSVTEAGTLTFARAYHSATLLADGSVVVAGGEGAGDVRSTAELFVPETGWKTVFPMHQARSRHVAGPVGQGAIVAGGGSDARAAELFDPGSLSWRPAPSLVVGRSGGAAVAVLSDGRLLVAGGRTGDRLLEATELYDPGFDPRPGGIAEIDAEPLSRRSLRLRFAAAGSDRDDPPPARAYIVKQSRRPIDDAASFKKARALCGGVCRFRPAEVGQLLTLRITGLRPDTRYYYAVRAVDAAGQRGPRSAGAAARTRR